MAKKKVQEKMELVDSLAVQYRPRTFAEMVGNEKAIAVIKGYFTQRKLVKTWGLFGPTGSGKTTLMRLMATAVNCQNLSDDAEPCLECDSCKLMLQGKHFDFKEINAGGEEGRIAGVESILDTLKTKPRFNAKIVCIDESHLMPSKASQLLLKVVEEPPKGVMFCIATTDPEKLPKAILGRCVKLNLEYPTEKETAKKMYSIAKEQYGKHAAALKDYMMKISKATNGQVRNSLAILEAVANIVIGKKGASEEEVEGLIKKVVADETGIDALALEFVKTLFHPKTRVTAASQLAGVPYGQAGNFLSKASQYASYLIASLSVSDFKKSIQSGQYVYKARRGFWGINHYGFEKDTLLACATKDGSLCSTDTMLVATAIAHGITEALKLLRTGVLSEQQALYAAYTNATMSIKV